MVARGGRPGRAVRDAAAALLTMRVWDPVLRSAHLRASQRMKATMLEDGPMGIETACGRCYALAMSGKTASILVFSVAALNGLTM
jgi:hypothetical protein